MATNGIVSAQDLPMEKQYVDDGFPTDFPVVAPFLADIDTSGGRGQIYYRVTETPSVLNRVAQVCVFTCGITWVDKELKGFFTQNRSNLPLPY